MPRLLAGLLLALLLALGVPRTAMAADPEVGPFIDAAAAVTTECEEYEPDHWLCNAQDDARSIFTSVTDFGPSFQVQSGRNRFGAAAPVPAEDDYYAHLSELVRLALGDDAEAPEWLALMNQGPEPSGQLVRGAWTLTWNAGMVGLSDASVANVSLDLFYFPSAAPSAPAPAAERDLSAYLEAYGLGCVEQADTLTCRRDLLDGGRLDAVYTVVMIHDASGDLVDLDASVTSFGDSMPSDAAGFLRGVAERTPVAEPALLAWFDAALTGGATTHELGEWAATWRDDAAADTRVWTLELVREQAVPTPDASEPAAPAAPPAPSRPPTTARSFADSVPMVGEVSSDPVVLLQSALLAALVVFLMPFPGQLFNSTLEAHEDEVRRWFRLDRARPLTGRIGAFWASWPGVVAFALLTTSLYGFLDPGFGFDIGSLATFAGMLLGLVLVTAAFAVPAIVAHRRIGDAPIVKVIPISLVVGLACVLTSRLTGFQPGYLYGLLIGLAFAKELSEADEGRATAIGAALMLAVGLGSWLALGALPEGEGFGLAVARTALASLMVAGLEGVVFGLLPMRFLPGEPLYAWNRIVWGALLLIGSFAFFHILINPASGYLSDTSRTPLVTVVALLIGFSLVSVVFWAWFRFRPEPTERASVSPGGR